MLIEALGTNSCSMSWIETYLTNNILGGVYYSTRRWVTCIIMVSTRRSRNMSIKRWTNWITNYRTYRHAPRLIWWSSLAWHLTRVGCGVRASRRGSGAAFPMTIVLVPAVVFDLPISTRPPEVAMDCPPKPRVSWVVKAWCYTPSLSRRRKCNSRCSYTINLVRKSSKVWVRKSPIYVTAAIMG